MAQPVEQRFRKRHAEKTVGRGFDSRSGLHSIMISCVVEVDLGLELLLHKSHKSRKPAFETVTRNVTERKKSNWHVAVRFFHSVESVKCL